MELDQRELATVLAALRFWQAAVVCRENMTLPQAKHLADIAMGGRAFQALSGREIDDLCERLNVQTKKEA